MEDKRVFDKKNIFSLEEKHCQDEKTCEKFIKNSFEEDTGTLCYSSEEKSPTCDLLNIMSNFGHIGYVQENFYQRMNDHEAADKLAEITLVQLNGWVKNAGKRTRITCEKRLTEKILKCYSESR